MQQINLKDLSLPQLRAIDDATEAFLFKQSGGEDFEPTFYDNKENFDKLIKLMVSSKKEIMGYFSKQFENRYNLINRNVVRWDEYDDYLYAEQWYRDQAALAVILEKEISHSYDLGIQALALTLGLTIAFSYQDVQKWITKRAEKAAGDITTTTRKRVKLQIEASLKAKEDREAFDARMKRVFMNPYRGRFIAQYEAIESYMEGKEGLAEQLSLPYKTALSSQAKDQLCGKVNGETVERHKPFSNGKMKPQFHYGCKCDIRYHDKPPKKQG